MGTFSHGLGQNFGSPNQFIKVAERTVEVNGRDFYCWEVDGTSNGANLENFNDYYKDVVRALLEGYKTLFIFAGIETQGEITQIEGIGAFNILCGALLPSQYADDYTNQLIDDYFTSDHHFPTLKGITFYDNEFHNKMNKHNIIDVMNSFNKYNLYTVPFSKINKYAEAWNSVKLLFFF